MLHLCYYFSELEGRYSILEREKVVLEQSQTQLLADYKTLYEQSSSYQVIEILIIKIIEA